MRPANVLHLRDTSEIGGPGKTILETHRFIDQTRFRLHLGMFLTRHERDDSPFAAAARDCGMPVYTVRGFNQYDPMLIWRVAQLVDALNIDILHAHEVKSDVIACLAARVRRVRLVTTLHGWIGNSVKQRALIGLDRRVVRAFDRVIAVSRRMHDELATDGIAPKNVRLLHNAIVVERYRRERTHGFLERLVGQPVSSPVIVSIGRLSREKGQADLVEAIGILAGRGLRVSAVLAGDGPERPGLQARVAALGLQQSIHLPGYVREPQRILNEADLLVLPSHTEGLPNAALEALAMEVPVLATAVGGTPEVITDGTTGRLVPSGSTEALARQIEEFLNNREPWIRMARAGREMVEREFDFAARTRKLEAIYAELLDGTPLQ